MTSDPTNNTPPLDPRDTWARLRILDANANRASEGLRVVEEYVRFQLADPYLSRELKQARHDLAVALETLPLAERLAARDTPGDVGTRITTATEGIRESVEQVVAANLERVAQALRCLEEYAKGYRPSLAVAAESIRYRTYRLAQTVVRRPEALRRLTDARLYVLLDGGADEASFARLAESLVAAGVDILQLRDKRLDDRDLIARARRLRTITRGTSTLFVMNDRPDLATLSDADGVHVGQEELSVADVRRIVGANMLIGVSTHAPDQARAATLDGADYLGCGPTFPSSTKQFESFPGLDYLKQVAAEIGLPAFAIGGITLERLPEVLATGVRRIAVSGAVTQAADPVAAAKQLAARLRA